MTADTSASACLLRYAAQRSHAHVIPEKCYMGAHAYTDLSKDGCQPNQLMQINAGAKARLTAAAPSACGLLVVISMPT